MTTPTDRVAAAASRLVANPVFAYGSIVLLQLHAVWGIGVGKDITTGDTASYFRDATRFAADGRIDIVWSPLYTSMYGALLRVLGDAYAATLAHRLVSVLALLVVVLAVARRFLAPWAAWAVAAWWAHLPIVYDALYEVHIFGAVPPLVAVLVAASGPPTPWRRGATLAVIGVGVVLVRNEMTIALALVASACVVADRRDRRPGDGRTRSRLIVFGVPAAVTTAVLVAGVVLDRHSLDALSASVERKHTLNVCQAYAFNMQQRGEFDGDPWVGCQPLLEEDFGDGEPTLVQATLANPAAMAGFVGWNVRLLPEGVQIGLFGATAGSENPDYASVQTGRPWAGIGAAAVVVVLAAGAVVLRSRPEVRRRRIREHSFALVVAGAITTTILFVALTQRPRPSYLFPVSVLVIIATVGSIQLLLSRTKVARLAPCLVPVALVALLVLVPSHFQPSYRPILVGYRALQPYADVLQRPGAVLVTTQYNELCAYLGSPERSCRLVQWGTIRDDAATAADVAAVLADAGASAVYADDVMLADAAVAAFVADADAHGWRIVARTTEGHPYAVLIPA